MFNVPVFAMYPCAVKPVAGMRGPQQVMTRDRYTCSDGDAVSFLRTLADQMEAKGVTSDLTVTQDPEMFMAGTALGERKAAEQEEKKTAFRASIRDRLSPTAQQEAARAERATVDRGTWQTLTERLARCVSLPALRALYQVCKASRPNMRVLYNYVMDGGEVPETLTYPFEKGEGTFMREANSVSHPLSDWPLTKLSVLGIIEGNGDLLVPFVRTAILVQIHGDVVGHRRVPHPRPLYLGEDGGVAAKEVYFALEYIVSLWDGSRHT